MLAVYAQRPNYQNVPGSVYKPLEGSISVHVSLMLQNFRVSILSEKLLEVRIPARRLGGTLTSSSSRFKMAPLCINRTSCTLHTSQCCFCVIILVVPIMLCNFSLQTYCFDVFAPKQQMFFFLTSGANMITTTTVQKRLFGGGFTPVTPDPIRSAPLSVLQCSQFPAHQVIHSKYE